MSRLEGLVPTIHTGNPLDFAIGAVNGVSTINKYGHNGIIASAATADVWDKGLTGGQLLWIAPTAARIHTIASTSAADDAGSTGATTVDVYYLADWDTEQRVERVSGDLNAGIAMSNAAVIIHRMIVIPQATSTSINVGIISATAASDGTVTAQIGAGDGQTHMAIYGIPSIDDLYIYELYSTANKASGTTGLCDLTLLVATAPDINEIVFTSKHTWSLINSGSSSTPQVFTSPKIIRGPAIVKIQALSGSAAMDVSAGFNGILVRK